VKKSDRLWLIDWWWLGGDDDDDDDNSEGDDVMLCIDGMIW